MLDEEILSKVKKGDIVYCNDVSEFESIYIDSDISHLFLNEPLTVIDVCHDGFEADGGSTFESCFIVKLSCRGDRWYVPWDFISNIDFTNSMGPEDAFTNSMEPEDLESLQKGEILRIIEDPKVYPGSNWSQSFFNDIWGCSAEYISLYSRGRINIFGKKTYGSLSVVILEGPQKGKEPTIPCICFQKLVAEKICPTCDGTGLLHYKDECPDCKGQGVLCSTTKS